MTKRQKIKIFSFILAIVFLTSNLTLWVYAEPQESAVQYKITASTKAEVISPGAKITGSGDKLIFKAGTGEIGANLLYHIPLEVIKKTGKAKLEIGENHMPYIDITMYWNTATPYYDPQTGAWQNVVFRSTANGVSKSFDIDISEKLSSASPETEYLILKIDMADLNTISEPTQTVVFDRILFYDPNRNIQPASTASSYNIMQNLTHVSNGNITHTPFGREGYTIKSSNGQPTGGNTYYYWVVPAAVVKQNPFLKLDFDPSSTALLTFVVGGDFKISYGDAASLGKVSYDLTAKAAALGDSDSMIVSLYLVANAGNEVINFNKFEFSDEDYVTSDKLLFKNGTNIASNRMTVSSHGTEGIKFQSAAGAGDSHVSLKLNANRTLKPKLIFELDYDVEKTTDPDPKILIILSDGTGAAAKWWTGGHTAISTLTGVHAINLTEFFGYADNNGFELLTFYIISNDPNASVEFKQLYLGTAQSGGAQTVPSCKIDYALGGGLNPVSNPVQFPLGESFVLGAAEKANAIFGGWWNGTTVLAAGETYTPNDSQVTLTAMWGLLGDINDDDCINDQDLALLEKILLKLAPEVPAADVNRDGVVDILDLMALQNILLSYENNDTNGYRPRLQNAVKTDYALASSFGTKGDGVTDDSEALESAIISAQLKNGIVRLESGIYRLSQNITIPADVEFVFDNGAVLSPDAGTNLAFNGKITAGNYAVFAGSGAITGTPVNVVGNPMWFGAKGDGVTDDTAAIQKTVNIFLQVDLPQSEQGYLISGDGITLRRNQLFQGAGEKSTKLKGAAGSRRIVQIKDSCAQVRYLDFDMSASANGICIFFNNSTNAIERVVVSDINATAAYRVVEDTDAAYGVNMIITTRLERINSVRGKGTGLILNNFWGFIYLSDITLDYSQSVNVNYSGFIFKRNEGGILTNINVIGNGVANSGAHGLELNGCIATWLYNCSVKNVGGIGIYSHSTARRAEHVYFEKCSASGSRGDGIYIDSYYTQLQGCSGKDSGGRGLYVAGRHQSVSSGTFTGNNSHGVYVNGARYSAFSDISVSNNKGNGINSNNSYNTYVNVTGSGNTSGLNNSTINARITTAPF